MQQFFSWIVFGEDTQRFLIERNTIEGLTDYGVQFYSSISPGSSDSIVRNNSFRNNGSAAFDGGGISVGGVNNIVYNNLVYGNYTSGIRIQYSGAFNIRVSDNKIYNQPGHAIYVGNAWNSLVENNVFNHNGLDVVVDQGEGTVQINNVISDTGTTVGYGPR